MPKNYYSGHESEPEPLSHSRSRDRRLQLPALHEVLGDLLEQPLRTSYATPEYSTRRSPSHQYDYSYPPDTRPRGPPLAPLGHTQMPQKARASSTTMSTATAQSPGGDSQQQHAYHLFNYTPNQGLVHQRSSTQEQDLEPSQPRPRLPPSDPSRKYVCTDCGNRFSKHSTLRNHLLTHSGEKPFECTFVGCGRRFSMACNMQRHLRTHTPSSGFDPRENRPSSTQPMSRGDSRGSSWDASSSRGGSPRDPDPGHYSYSYRR